MNERQVVLDEPLIDEQSQALRSAMERAERAEAELAKIKREPKPSESSSGTSAGGHASRSPELTGVEALRQDAMMAHLLDSLDVGTDIGHYGRLVFAMIARHFMTDDEVVAELTKDPDFSVDQAVGMLHQVEGRDYSPPRRERIMEWQSQQEFPILPAPEDPDCGNVYRSLKFPQEIYEHIGHYQEEKASAGG